MMSSDSEKRIFAFLDVDRCLLDTEKAFALVRSVSDEKSSVSAATIDRAYAQHKLAKKSFNVTGFIESQLEAGESWETTILPDFVSRGRQENLLMPHAKEFLQKLGSLGIDYGLLTYGSWSNEVDDPAEDRKRSIKWQLAKIAASAELAATPTLVIGMPEKTRYISEHLTDVDSNGTKRIILPDDYRENNGIFADYYDKAIVVDDKLIAHQDGDPEYIRGILVTPESIENRNDHHIKSSDVCIAGLREVIGLRQAGRAVESIVSEIRG